VADLLAPNCKIVIRIGGESLDPDDIETGLRRSLEEGLACDSVELVEPLTISEIRNRQTNVFRPGTTGKRVEYDFVVRAA